MIDGLTVRVRASETYGGLDRPNVSITVEDPHHWINALNHAMSSYLVWHSHDAPGHGVYEPETINQVGLPGAVRFMWMPGWSGDWLRERIDAAIAEAKRELADRPEPEMTNDELRSVAAGRRHAHELGIEMPADMVALATRRAVILARSRQRDLTPDERAEVSEIARRADRELKGDSYFDFTVLYDVIQIELERAANDGGQIDAVGTFTVRRLNRASGVEYRPLIRMWVGAERGADLRQAWGGSISRSDGRTTVLWEITGQPMAQMIAKIRPHLWQQCTQADALLELRELTESSPRPRRGSPRPAEQMQQMEEIAERVRALNTPAFPLDA
jgi:hypothetical protein